MTVGNHIGMCSPSDQSDSMKPISQRMLETNIFKKFQAIKDLDNNKSVLFTFSKCRFSNDADLFFMIDSR